MDYTLNIVSKCRFFFIFKHSRAPKRSWKIFHGVLESPGKILDFFVSKRVGTLAEDALLTFDATREARTSPYVNFDGATDTNIHNSTRWVRVIKEILYATFYWLFYRMLLHNRNKRRRRMYPCVLRCSSTRLTSSWRRWSKNMSYVKSSHDVPVSAAGVWYRPWPVVDVAGCCDDVCRTATTKQT